MFGRLARFLIRQRVRVLIAAGLLVVLAGAVGGNVAKHLSSGGFADPGAESERARHALEDTFHQGDPNFVLLITAKRGSVDDPAVTAEAAALIARLQRTPHIAQAVSYWSLGKPPPLKSKDGRQALLLARIDGTQDQVQDRVKEI